MKVGDREGLVKVKVRVWFRARQDKNRQDEARKDKTRQDNTRQDNTRQDKPGLVSGDDTLRQTSISNTTTT